MLSHEDICKAVSEVAARFPLKKVSYFGSYAEGRASMESDLDLLVEFVSPSCFAFGVLSSMIFLRCGNRYEQCWRSDC